MRPIKFSLIFSISLLFIASCTNETKTDTTLPDIKVFGKKLDTAALNSYYKDEKAEIIINGKCTDIVITGSVNTAKPGTYYIDYDYTDPNGNRAATATRTVHVLVTHNDSIKRKEIFSLYQKITISKHWRTKDKIAKEINLDISTQPIIYLDYSFGNSIITYKITDVKNQIDSLVLTTTEQISDSVYIWTFKPISKTKGTWSILKPQINYNNKLGTFLTIDN